MKTHKIFVTSAAVCIVIIGIVGLYFIRAPMPIAMDTSVSTSTATAMAMTTVELQTMLDSMDLKELQSLRSMIAASAATMTSFNDAAASSLAETSLMSNQ